MIKGKFLIPALLGVMTISSLGMTTLAADTTTSTTTSNSISHKKAKRETIKLELANKTAEERKAFLEEKHQERENIQRAKPNNGKLREEQIGEGRPKDGKLKKEKPFNGLSTEEISAFKDMTEQEKKAYLEEKYAKKLALREKFESMTNEEKEALLPEKHNKKTEGAKQL